MSPLFDALDFLPDPDPHPAALNMALDEILLQRLARPLLRVYTWLRPAVSFGYFERFEPVKNQFPGRELVRRWTGGGVVPHGQDLTYSLLAPAGSEFLRLRTAESYRVIHERIAEALRCAGAPVCMAGADGQKISQACFENPARHDILFQGRKIAGAAQRRSKPGLLHQGSIQAIALPAAFGETLAAAFSGSILEKKIGAEEMAAARRLAESKYATEAWNRKF
jgi:lipoate-protein ligase A